MEYPNIVLISDDIADYDTYKQVIVHEIAHQWWYGVVGNNQYYYGWLDDGLTEYSTALFYDYYSDSQITSEQIVRNSTTAYSTFMILNTAQMNLCVYLCQLPVLRLTVARLRET